MKNTCRSSIFKTVFCCSGILKNAIAAFSKQNVVEANACEEGGLAACWQASGDPDFICFLRQASLKNGISIEILGGGHAPPQIAMSDAGYCNLHYLGKCKLR